MVHGTRVKIMVRLHNYGTVWQRCDKGTRHRESKERIRIGDCDENVRSYTPWGKYGIFCKDPDKEEKDRLAIGPHQEDYDSPMVAEWSSTPSLSSSVSAPYLLRIKASRFASHSQKLLRTANPLRTFSSGVNWLWSK